MECSLKLSLNVSEFGQSRQDFFKRTEIHKLHSNGKTVEKLPKLIKN
jgi:hypothetical protein